MTDFDCATCGQHMEGIEFHPLLFCILKKAGIHDQARFLAASGFRLSAEQEAQLREWHWPIPNELIDAERNALQRLVDEYEQVPA